MNIPESVKIGNLNYKVSFVNRVDNGDARVDGQITYDALTIKLKPIEDNKEYVESVFIHEVVHGIFESMNLEQTEDIVDRLSKGFHQVILDNPNMFKEV